MSDRSLMRFRSLPEGSFQQVKDTGWDGNILQLTLPEGQPAPVPGGLVEIESESKLYLGEVRQCTGNAVRILIEHSLDRAQLAAMKDTWRRRPEDSVHG
jgi:hypothetical protein